MISCGTPSFFVDLLQEYSDAGANHVNVVFVPVDKSPEQLKLFGLLDGGCQRTLIGTYV